MTTSESKGRFFYKTDRFEWIRITNRIDSNRELECSSGDALMLSAASSFSVPLPLRPVGPCGIVFSGSLPVRAFSLQLSSSTSAVIGNESAPIQLAQCRFPGLAISSACDRQNVDSS